MKKKVPITTIALTALLQNLVAAAGCPPDTLLNLLPTTPESFREETVQTKGHKKKRLVLAGDRGTLLYHLANNGQVFYVDLIEIPEPFRNQKYSHLLVEEALRRSGGQIREVHGDLRWSNYKIFKSAWDNLPTELKSKYPEEAAKTAVRETPFFKSFKRLGFEKVNQAEAYTTTIEFGSQSVIDYGVNTVLTKNSP